MGILDVKCVPWPEPGPKVGAAELRVALGTALGGSDGQIQCTSWCAACADDTNTQNSARRSEVFVYGEPPQGKQLAGSVPPPHLESRLRELLLPSNSSDDDVRAELEKHLGGGRGNAWGAYPHVLPACCRTTQALWTKSGRMISSRIGIFAGNRRRRRASAFCAVFATAVRVRVQLDFSLSAVLRLPSVVEEIETGKQVIPHAQCENCKKDAKAMCRPCRAVSYCTPACAKAQWPTHKLVCKISTKILSDPSSLPKDTLYLPARAYLNGSRNSALPLYRSLQGGWDPEQGKVVCYDQGTGTACLYDRRRSVIVRLGPQEAAKIRAASPKTEMPFHEAGYRQFTEVVKERGAKGVLFIWVRRVGDCMVVDLKDIPNQQGIRWK
ncbi:hypothetical protein B0H14DRAFT_2599393 [Mycena olivaceomarginata]|nr:hypothetical protein B0H14DRAFT_2599393 [Mycena olivaceomarginata]